MFLLLFSLSGFGVLLSLDFSALFEISGCFRSEKIFLILFNSLTNFYTRQCIYSHLTAPSSHWKNVFWIWRLILKLSHIMFPTNHDFLHNMFLFIFSPFSPDGNINMYLKNILLYLLDLKNKAHLYFSVFALSTLQVLVQVVRSILGHPMSFSWCFIS